MRHEASETVPGMPSPLGFGSAPHGQGASSSVYVLRLHSSAYLKLNPSARHLVDEVSVKCEPTDLHQDLLHTHAESSSVAIKRRRGRAIDERRQALIDDPRTGDVLPHEVWCLMCKKWIKLYKDVEYIEANWLRHAERCYLRAIANGFVSLYRTSSLQY